MAEEPSWEELAGKKEKVGRYETQLREKGVTLSGEEGTFFEKEMERYENGFNRFEWRNFSKEERTKYSPDELMKKVAAILGSPECRRKDLSERVLKILHTEIFPDVEYEKGITPGSIFGGVYDVMDRLEQASSAGRLEKEVERYEKKTL